MNHYKLLIGLLLISFSSSLAQDPLERDTIKVETSFDTKIAAKHVLSALNSDTDCLNCPIGRLTDNPINHFAIFSLITFNLHLNDKYKFNLGLLSEERGFSFGNFTRRNLVVIPYIHISTLDTFNLRGIQIKHDLTAGDMWNEDIHDILRFNNIDYQGIYTRVGLGPIWLGFVTIADLSRSIGLEMGELHRLSLEYEKTGFKYLFGFNANTLSNDPEFHPEPTDISISNYLKKTVKKFDIEVQADVRFNKTLNTSFAGAIVVSGVFNKLKIKNSLRYYDADFNKGYKNDKLSYRGDNLYPIKNYHRDMSQWALFTDFQESALFNYELVADYKWALTRRINLATKLDGNLIYDITNEEILFFPAYDLMFHFHYLNGLKFEIGITNKHMEVNNHYQSSALSRLPFITYGFTVDVNNILKREEQIIH